MPDKNSSTSSKLGRLVTVWRPVTNSDLISAAQKLGIPTDQGDIYAVNITDTLSESYQAFRKNSNIAQGRESQSSLYSAILKAVSAVDGSQPYNYSFHSSNKDGFTAREMTQQFQLATADMLENSPKISSSAGGLFFQHNLPVTLILKDSSL